MEYEINGCKIIVKRESADTGITLIEGLLNAMSIRKNEPKEECRKDESESCKPE